MYEGAIMKAITLYYNLKEWIFKKNKLHTGKSCIWHMSQRQVKVNIETTQVNEQTQGLGFEVFIDNMVCHHRVLESYS